VASVSCIFGLGEPEDYHSMRIDIENDIEFGREKVLSDLVAMHYERNDFDFHRGVFRVRGDRIEIFPAYEEDKAVRVEFFGDEIEGISEIDPLTGKALGRLKRITIFPASHYVTQKGTLQRATASIQTELKERIDYLQKERKLIEAQRIEERTNFDLEMMQELGYCTGIENYSRHFTGRAPGEPPPTLLDYFPDDYLIFVDESHISIPQLNAMYKGDKSRKETLVEFGFRLPSALDNRPLKFEEFESKTPQIIYVSATPAEYELKKGRGALAEQIVRPTGLIDPKCDVRSAENQVDNLYEEILGRMERGERVLVTTLTKRMAEDLTDYYSELGIRVRYLHSGIRTLERMDIIRDLRKGTFDVLIGINLLREGLDIPEVSLVAILDADKEGFLRSTRSLIQTSGRASRNVGGQVIMYGDHITRSMKTALAEMDRRRKIQTIYNKKNNITPTSIKKNLPSIFESVYESDYVAAGSVSEPLADYASTDNLDDILMTLEKEMGEAAKKLEFEKAAELRDRISEIKKSMIFEFR
jgi:excinuclease ABC subunit B